MILKNIAAIAGPNEFTVSDTVNIVSFSPIVNENTKYNISFIFTKTYSDSSDEYPEQTVIRVWVPALEKEMIFKGTTNTKNVNATTFYLANDTRSQAELVRMTLLKNEFLAANYNITVPFDDGASLVPSNRLRIEAKKGGAKYNLSINVEDQNFMGVFSLTDGVTNSSFESGKEQTQFDLDIYKTNEKLGTNLPPYGDRLGDYITTLSKQYTDKNIWFNINPILKTFDTYDTEVINEESGTWCNLGTINSFRVVAKKYDGKTIDKFYISNPIFVIKGRSKKQVQPNMRTHSINTSNINIKRYPLTTLMERDYIMGDEIIFNFAQFDEANNAQKYQSYNYKIRIDSYSTMGNWLYSTYSEPLSYSEVRDAATIKLERNDIGANEAYFTLTLMFGEYDVTYPVRYNILKDCKYDKEDKLKLYFLNSIGGWEYFSFTKNTTKKYEFKSSTSYYPTITNTGLSHIGYEGAMNIDVEETIEATTHKLTKAEADWLKELMISDVIIQKDEKGETHRLLVDDFDIVLSNDDETYNVKAEFRYSDKL